MSTFSLLTWHGIARTLQKNCSREFHHLPAEPFTGTLWRQEFLANIHPKAPDEIQAPPSSSCLRSNRQQLLPIPHGVLLHACPDGSCAQGQRHSCPLSAGQQRRPWIDKEFFFLFELVCFSGARVLFSSAFVTADAEADRLGYILGGLQSG